MAYIELYSDEILEAASLGKSINDFYQSEGDYIKVQIFDQRGNTDNLIETLYSNKLLLKYETGDYYLGDYHYHEKFGFMVGLEHTTQKHEILLPTKENTTEIDERVDFDTNENYKKQVTIYKDDKNQIYIKPNELLKLLPNTGGNDAGVNYKLRIHFLRNLKTTIGKMFNYYNNNLIENGNFFAGLEATQAGDLDASRGLNRFTMMQNPGMGRFVLEQDGAGDNEYNMLVTGIEPNSNYVLSTWIAYNNKYDGDKSLAHFDTAVSNGQQTSTNSYVSHNVGFRLKGSEYNGWPHCNISVNGRVISEFFVENSTYSYYNFQLPDIPGLDENTTLEFTIRFDNDTGASIGSRDLYVHNIQGDSGVARITDSNNYLIDNESNVIPNSSVLYYNLDGTLANHFSDEGSFPGEFRGNMAWNGELKIKVKASALLTFSEEEIQSQIPGLVTTPLSPSYETDEFTSYQIPNQPNPNQVRNLQEVNINGLMWYRRFKLVSTNEEADLGSLRIHLGKSIGDEVASSTLGRRYFCDVRFEKIENFNTALTQHLNNLVNSDMGISVPMINQSTLTEEIIEEDVGAGAQY